MFGIAGQFRNFQGRKWGSKCLADIEDAGDFEPLVTDLLCFFFRLAVRSKDNLLGRRIYLFHFKFPTEGHWGDDVDRLFSFLYLTVKFLLPGIISGNHSSFRILQSDQQGIVEAVLMELCHGGQIVLVILRGKDLFDTCLQPVCDLF